jgi:TonB family protein
LRTLPFLLLPLTLHAQNPPDARVLLSRADAPIFTAKTVRLAATHSTTFTTDKYPLPGNPFKLEFIRGGRGRAEFVGITLMIFDGANLWEYHNLGNQYTKKPATSWVFQGEIATLDYGRNPDNIIAASYERDETLDFGGRQVSCYVVRADYRGAPNNRSGKHVVRRAWISKDKELILRDYWEGDVTVGMSVAMAERTNYTTVETDIQFPDDLFVFQPPPRSKEGEPMILGGIIGYVPSADRVVQTRVEPEYSPEARAAGLQSSVIVSIDIMPDGHIQNPRVIHGPGMGLDQMAVDAIKQWRYDAVNPNARIMHQAVDVPFRLKPQGPWVFDGSVLAGNSGGAAATQSMKPELLRYVAPDAALCSAQGYVGLSFNIGVNGVPSDIQVTTAPDDRVGRGVLKTVQSWRFRATAENGSNRTGSARVLLECRPAGTSIEQSNIYPASVVTAPVPLFKVDPEYSEEARNAKLEGDVALSFVVETDGKVSGVQIVKPLGSDLNVQAIASVLQWRFQPAMKDAKPVRARVQTAVSFRLR